MFKGGDTNLYGYVLNDPINMIDPNGLWGIQIGVQIGGTFGFPSAGIGGGLAITYSPGAGLQVGGYGSSQFGAGLGLSAGRGLSLSYSPNACSLGDLDGTQPTVGLDTPIGGGSVGWGPSGPTYNVNIGPSIGGGAWFGGSTTQTTPIYAPGPQPVR